jgi:hypothetical protein
LTNDTSYRFINERNRIHYGSNDNDGPIHWGT